MLRWPGWLSLFLLLHGGLATQTTREILHQLGRQVMLDRLAMEERIRSDGQSGLKQIRINDFGTESYYSPTAIGNSVCVMHDHPNYPRNIGLGEFIGVLNGVEFRSRHNDYKLVMPHNTSSLYRETMDIPQPPVPPSVLSQGDDVKKQTDEMKVYFRAFKEQDITIRDYRPYFKPVLCYLEGGWTTNTDKLEESFDSPRHAINATDWFDLQEKIRYTSLSGHKSNLENFAYLPTTIFKVENGSLTLAQWNFRILCHPLRKDLPTNHFHLIDDLAGRMAYDRNLGAHLNSRAARFQLNSKDQDEFEPGFVHHSFLDDLMEQVPGMDNYQAMLPETVFGLTSYKLTERNDDPKVLLNVGYYNRWFKVEAKGAMGRSDRHRGFSDASIFMAQTTRPQIAGIDVESCHPRSGCTMVTQRWTYAVPLEIIYMTPLQTWNPFGIEYKPDKSPNAEYVKKDGRDGTNSTDRAYNGTGTGTFCRTPPEFFESTEGRDPADTFGKPIYVLDKNGEVRRVAASGHRIFQNVKDLGYIRLRFPIPPLHYEGSAIWKELRALMDVVLEPTKYTHMFREALTFTKGDAPPTVPPGGLILIIDVGRVAHNHFLDLTKEQSDALNEGKSIRIRSTEVEGDGNHHDDMYKVNKTHSHEVLLNYRVSQKSKSKFYYMDECDGQATCGHNRKLLIKY